jgi:hypothetical protein
MTDKPSDYATTEQWMDSLRNKVGSVNLMQSMGIEVSEKDLHDRDIAERQLRQLEEMTKTGGGGDAPDLSAMSTAQKVDMIARKLIGDPWTNEPGILATLHLMSKVQEIATSERRELQVKVAAQSTWISTMVVIVAAMLLIEVGLILDLYLF